MRVVCIQPSRITFAEDGRGVTVLSSKTRLAWVSDGPVPGNVREATGSGWLLERVRPGAPLAEQLAGVAVALVSLNGSTGDPERVAALLDALERAATVGVFLLPTDAAAGRRRLEARGGSFICVDSEATAGELAAKLSAAAELQPAICRLQTQVSALRQGGNGPARAADGLDEEMRLAAKLQRDFLPSRLPEVGPARFAALLRPVGWVSGDIYDITRLDETHVGFYVVDAVGHGMPAALLTMFIKKALQTKRIVGNTYQIVPPHASLAELNADICRQDLPSCQFCTAFYAVLDTATLKLTYCRAGHPESVVFHADGTSDLLAEQGSLLGVFPDQRYVSQEVQLAPGDRVVLHTDGAEEALRGDSGPEAPATFGDMIGPWVKLPREEMLLRLTALFDARDQAGQVADDITVVVMDIEPSRRSEEGTSNVEH